MEDGLKLKPSQCNFFCSEISYLGNKVSTAGMEPGTECLKGITEIDASLSLSRLGYHWMPWPCSRS